jgi:hypothetical protein
VLFHYASKVGSCPNIHENPGAGITIAQTLPETRICSACARSGDFSGTDHFTPPQYYLYLQDTSLNVITTVLPLCLTLSLFTSAVIHRIFPTTLLSKEERTCRTVEQWAQSFVVSGFKPLDDGKEGLTLSSAYA